MSKLIGDFLILLSHQTRWTFFVHLRRLLLLTHSAIPCHTYSASLDPTHKLRYDFNETNHADRGDKYMAKPTDNYEIFRMQALQRFLTFDQAPLIRRLNLTFDDQWIYIPYLGTQYRLHRTEPAMDRQTDTDWFPASCNETLTICDLLCHTTEPICLSGQYCSLESLNRVKGGTASATLGRGFYQKTADFFDGKEALLKKACEFYGGTPGGKGDVAYTIPLSSGIGVHISYYGSDDEFPAQLSLFFDRDICQYLHYETLYYAAGHLLQCLTQRVEKELNSAYV